jgi:hypothetical protein
MTATMSNVCSGFRQIGFGKPNWTNGNVVDGFGKSVLQNQIPKTTALRILPIRF